MLKITVCSGSTGSVLELEGKLAGPWVEELKGCWRGLVIVDQTVAVHLKAVSFIDPRGKELLREMHRWGATLVATGCMTKAIIEEIQRDKVRGLERC